MAQVEVTFRNTARVVARLEKLRGRPLADRLNQGALEAARLVAEKIKAEAPVKTGKLKGSVRASKGSRGGAYAGPGAPHRHLVIRGHRIVTPGGRDTGRRSKANPFPGRAADAARPAALDIVRRAILSD